MRELKRVLARGPVYR